MYLLMIYNKKVLKGSKCQTDQLVLLYSFFFLSLGSIDCTLKFSHPAWYWENLLKICVFIFAFIMPVLIITVCYGLMILRLKSVRMLSGSKEKDRNLRRITRMVLVVVAVFIICWTPIHIYVIVKALVNIPETTFQTVSWHFCIALGYTNSCLNPVLYAFLDENFKRCFREFCIPTSSTIEQQNSTRVRQNTRDHASTANTVDRTNHQVWLAVEMSSLDSGHPLGDDMYSEVTVYTDL